MTDSAPLSRLAALVAAALILGGCASFSSDGGFEPVQRAAREQLGKEAAWARSEGDADSARQRVAELLAQPLSPDAAVQIALLNNPGLQADYQELGIAEADLVQAGRLPNPGFSFARLGPSGQREIDRTFSLDLARLVTLPLAHQAESHRFAATQRNVSMRMLALAAQTRSAYYAAVAADQSLAYSRDVMASAEAGAELARRMAQVGNWSTLQQAREHGHHAQARLDQARAQQARVATRERLTRLLGLWGDQAAFRLPERLPELPAEPAERPDIEQVAMAQRLDVQDARLQAEATAKNLGLARVTRFVNVLELGWQHNTTPDSPRQTGYEVSLEIPLFDWGGARTAKAEAIYLQSVQRAAQTAIDARSEVREAYQAWRSAYEVARHYRDDIVPMARRVSEENLLRYNGMLISVFELLADARAQASSVNAAIEALRDFWIAQSDLDMALVGPPAAH